MPDEDASLHTLLLRLEQDLMQPSVRIDPEKLSELIDVDFLEIGKSGRMYDKAAILEEMRNDPEVDPPSVRNFAVSRVSAELALVTYQTARVGSAGVDITMRSSIWVFRNGNWRVRFHQGTPLRLPADNLPL